jgi:hypothetical protein
MKMEETVKQTFSLTKENDERLRDRNRHKGDMSNIVNQALEDYFRKHPLEKK